MRHLVASLRPLSGDVCPGAAAPGEFGAGVPVTGLQLGEFYALHVGAPVALTFGDTPSPRSRVVFPDTPFMFRCDSETMNVHAATTSPAGVWLHPCIASL